MPFGGLRVFGDGESDGVTARATAGARREQRVLGASLALCQPGSERQDGLCREGRAAPFASFLFATDMDASAELDVPLGAVGRLRSPAMPGWPPTWKGTGVLSDLGLPLADHLTQAPTAG